MPGRITELELLLDAATEAIGKYMQDNEKLYRENERLKQQTAERNTKIAVMLTKAVNDGCKHAKDIQDVFCGIG